MAERVSGAKVLGLRRRSKYIMADLDSDETLLIHLGMSGRILVSGDPLGKFAHDHPLIEKHDHVIFSMENGARITFNDPRRFGAMVYWMQFSDAHLLLRNIGPEPFGNEFNENYLVNILKKKFSDKICTLDQRIVAGLGISMFAGFISCRDLSKKLAKSAPSGRRILNYPGFWVKDHRWFHTEGFSHSNGEWDIYIQSSGREGEACTNTDCGRK